MMTLLKRAILRSLEQRGYVARDPKTGEYALSLRLFQLATQHPPARRLQQAALPVMEDLAAAPGEFGNSADHLGVAALSARLDMLELSEAPLRTEGGVPVAGLVFVLRRS